jgi:hypothetical protein
MFWRTRQFKVISQAWELKLEKSGFVDAEIEVKGDRVLKQRATNCYRQASQLDRESRLEYFTFLGYLAHNTQFKSELEKIVMIRHSEGKTSKEILKELNKNGIIRCRQNIEYIIRRWQNKWGVKSWSLKQMGLKK